MGPRKKVNKSPSAKFTVYAMIILSYFFGVVSLLVWLIFLFFGSINLIDFKMDEITRFLFNTGLCLVFFIQHSSMTRKSFHRWLAKHMRNEYYAALYSISSGITLLVLVLFWQESIYTLAAPQGIVRWLLRAAFFLAIAGFYWGTRAIGSFDVFGVKSLLNHLRGLGPPQPTTFMVRGPYRWVRHPFYSLSLLMIWSFPDLTADRLLFNVLWTVWVIVGTILEERDLVASFGDAYLEYQRQVPMLIPSSIRPASPNSANP
jgi:protein-S-isoprenylcysteine O-methyltransferase Ste14